MKPAGKLVLLLLILGGAAFGYKMYRDKNPQSTTASEGNVEISSEHKEALSESETAFVISGSSVINDELSVELVKSFMEQANYSDIQVISTGKKEKSVIGTSSGKKYRFDIKSPGTKDGFQALDGNSADICMASAPADPEFRDKTIENVIGLDGIAVITNEANPISSLYKEDLAKIFSGKISSWSGVSGSSSGGSIKVYRMGDKTGIYKMFKEMVMSGSDIQGDAFEKSQEMVDAISKDPNGIGFVSYTFLKSSTGIKEVPVGDIKGIQAITPNSLTIASEKYPLCRRLYMYRSKSTNNPNTMKFVKFVSSDAGQKIVDGSGFIGLAINNDKGSEMLPTDPIEYKGLVNTSKKITTEFRFQTASQDLDSRGLDDVDRLVDYLSQPQYRNKSITLVGFTDNTGNVSANKGLSMKRASSVKAILEAKGIQVSSTIGMGVLRPVRDNSTEQNRSFNRRVEVWIEN